jgi:hypothetical protein
VTPHLVTHHGCACKRWREGAKVRYFVAAKVGAHRLLRHITTTQTLFLKNETAKKGEEKQLHPPIDLFHFLAYLALIIN